MTSKVTGHGGPRPGRSSGRSSTGLDAESPDRSRSGCALWRCRWSEPCRPLRRVRRNGRAATLTYRVAPAKASRSAH